MNSTLKKSIYKKNIRNLSMMYYPSMYMLWYSMICVNHRPRLKTGVNFKKSCP